MSDMTRQMELNARKERALQERVRAGHIVEDPSEMTDRYRDVLTNTIHIAADLEVMVLPTYLPAIRTAPTLEHKIAVASACQDELGHAQVMYRLLEDFGYDTNHFLLEREPREWRSFQMVEYPHRDYIEFVVSLCFADRAGYITTADLEQHCSYGPFARSLRKVNFEERFHVEHGERWVRYFCQHSDALHRRVQAAVDFYFPLCVAWFGLPDHLKTRTDQLTYRIRGASNDEMRQKYLSRIVPFAEKVGLHVPAHLDEETGLYVLDFEMPIYLDLETRTWDYGRRITWEEQVAIWKQGSPYKIPAIRRLQEEEWGDALW